MSMRADRWAFINQGLMDYWSIRSRTISCHLYVSIFSLCTTLATWDRHIWSKSKTRCNV